MQRIRGERGGVALGRYETAEGVAHMLGGDPGRVEKMLTLDQLDQCAAGSTRGTATPCVETGLDDESAADPDGHTKDVATGGATGGAGVRPSSEGAEPTRRVEMILEQHGAQE